MRCGLEHCTFRPAFTLPNSGAKLSAGMDYAVTASMLDLGVIGIDKNYGTISYAGNFFDHILAGWKAAEAKFSASPISGDEPPLVVSFTDMSNPGDSGIKSWFWDFGDGTSSSEQNPMHTYQESGTYEVTLTIEGNGLTFEDPNKPAKRIITIGERKGKDRKRPFIPGSEDPNEIIGSLGYDTPESVAAMDAWKVVHHVDDHPVCLPGCEPAPLLHNWIQVDDQTLTYTVYFENLTTATAAAQEVFVNQQLDANLDWSTFEMQEVVFNNQIVTDVQGMANGSVLVDDLNNVYSDGAFQVQIDTSVNYTTGVIDWYLRSYDPNTFDNWPTDPYAGFLPPNDKSTYCGEGYITYTVQMVDGLETSDTIESTAEIIFDYNEPIDTNPSWTNTIDIDAPTSSIAPSTGSDPTPTLVQWSGTDVGAGILSYDIFVSEDGGPWTLWLDNTTKSQAYFINSRPETTYSFYSVATDFVGLEEQKTPAAEATIVTPAFPEDQRYLMINGTAGDDTFRLDFSDNQLQWSLNGVEQEPVDDLSYLNIQLDGLGGHDSLLLRTTERNDYVRIAGDSLLMTTGSLRLDAMRFSEMIALADNGGWDGINLLDIGQGDTFVTQPHMSLLITESSQVTACGFDDVNAIAVTDATGAKTAQAVIIDSAIATSDQTRMSYDERSGQETSLRGFQTVDVRMSHGHDTLYAFDSPQDDLLVADDTSVQFYTNVAEHVASTADSIVTARGMDRVYAYSLHEGDDDLLIEAASLEYDLVTIGDWRASTSGSPILSEPANASASDLTPPMVSFSAVASDTRPSNSSLTGDSFEASEEDLLKVDADNVVFYTDEDKTVNDNYRLLAEACYIERIKAQNERDRINEKDEKADELARLHDLIYFGDWETN
jgi:PKD repeat protein